MLAPRRCCLDYLDIYSDVTKRWLLTRNQNIHITYYMHIPHLNSKIGVDYP